MLHGLNIANRGPYGQACTRDTSDADIQVVCRQLGCDPVGALRVDPVQYVHLLKLRYEPFWWSEWSHTQLGDENRGLRWILWYHLEVIARCE